ncbi:MAG: DUF1499 domain-containing protein [Leptospira sp.]|nr:DUF1499 domain-containing protein [Leptospira sp.]
MIKFLKNSLGLAIVIFFAMQCSGTRPEDIGIRENKQLKACPPSPNCVTSFCDPTDEEHYIESISFSGKADEAMNTLKEVILKQERSAIIVEKPNYIHAEFTTKLMRYVDDVEFLLDDKNKKIHVRSASRLGRKDFGVNRERIEKIRSDLGWK